MTGRSRSAGEALEPDDVEVRDALVLCLRQEAEFWDLEPLQSWAEALLTPREERARDAWWIIETRLRDPGLEDPALLAAGWLLGLRGDTAADVLRDTRLTVAVVLAGQTHQGEPSSGVVKRRLVAAACFARDPEWAKELVKRPRRAGSVFQYSKRSDTPAERRVALRLLRAAEEWFAQDSAHVAEGAVTAMELASAPSAPRAGEPAAGLIERYADVLAHRLDRPAPHYPPHLTPSVLASTMSVTRLSGRRSDTWLATGRLYGDAGTHNGMAALPTIAGEGRAVLLGDPGSGKSTILAACATEAIRADKLRPVVFCRLADVVDQLAPAGDGSTLEGTLRVLIEAATPGHFGWHDAKAVELLGVLRDRPDALVVLDGLDEVDPAHQPTVVTLLEQLDQIAGAVLVSSRHTGYQSLGPQWIEYNVDRLNSDQADDFLVQWFGDTTSSGYARARKAIEREPGPVNPARRRSSIGDIPVLLGIAAVVAEHDDVPENPSDLYERYLERFFQRAWARSHSDPGSRLSGVDLDYRLLIAETLAFAMTGSPGRPSPGIPRDVATKADLYRAVAAGDRPLVDGFFAEDGILVPHGRHEYERAQPVRWLHKTVHEFLIGNHLARLFHSDHDTWAAHLRRAMQLGDHWVVPLNFMMTSLGEAHHDAIFEVISGLTASGDPGGVIKSTTYDMAQVLPEGALFRQRTVHLLADAGHWDSVYRLDKRAWRRLLLDAYAHPGGVDLIPGWVSSVLASEDPQLRIPLRAAVRRLVARPDHTPLGSILLFWGNQPDFDVWLNAELLRADGAGFLPMITNHPPDYSSEAIVDALNVIEHAAPDARSEFVRFVSFDGVDLRNHVGAHPWLADEPLETYATIAAPKHDRADATGFVWTRNAAALTGSFGRAIACAVAQDISLDDYPDIEPAAWAVIGDALHELEHLERDTDPTLSSRADLAHSLHVLSSDEQSLDREPVDVLPLLRTVLAWARDPDGIPDLTDVLDTYHEIVRLERWHGDIGAARAGVTDQFERTLSRILTARQPEALAALLATDPIQWIRDAGRPTFGAALTCCTVNEDDLDRLADLAAWASATPADPMDLLHKPLRVRLSDWLRSCELRGIFVESFSTRSRNAVARDLSAEGVLPEWRDRLLDLPPAGATTHQRP